MWLNRSKESITLDLKRPAAADILRRLLRRADVFVQNLAPGAAERLGAGASTLRADDPRLIVCNITGYGATGPYASKRAYDLLVQSEVGVVSITGTEDTPSRVGISIADIAAGMYAYSGVLTALLARQRTDEGATVDVSLFDSLGEWMGFPVYHTLYSGLSLPRSSPNHASIAPYGPFTTAGAGGYFLPSRTHGSGRGSAARCCGTPRWLTITGTALSSFASATGQSCIPPSRACANACPSTRSSGGSRPQRLRTRA